MPMHSFLHRLRSCLLLAAIAALPAAAAIERSLEKTFTVVPGSVVKVDVSGAAIQTEVGPAGSVHLVLKERLRTDDAAEADKLLERFEITCVQQGDTVKLVVRPKKSLGFSWSWNNKVEFRPVLTVPADVRLELDTSGGSIRVGGEMRAAVHANTSGGSITADGGTDLNLDTSGGSIRVGHASGQLRADTSGGGITVDLVGPGATEVTLDTSGGSIQVGVDPAARLFIAADTSGGSAKVEGFAAAFEAERKERSHVSGRLNGGGGNLRADTSGGSIRIGPASR